MPAPRAILGYDGQDDMYMVKSMQKKWRDSFPGTAVDASKWTTVRGTGGAATVGSGQLTLGAGTTANQATHLTSVPTFTVPFRVCLGLSLSQRIANQTFYFEIESVDPATRLPNGVYRAAWVFDGTTATNAKYEVQNGGAALTSPAQTVATTASASVFEIELFADECWFHQRAIDSTAGRTFSAVRHQQIPDPNGEYVVKLRWLNGGTNPASNTNMVTQYVVMNDYAELTAEITAGRGQLTAGQSIGTQLTGIAAGLNTPVLPTPLAAANGLTTTRTYAAATTNATSVKASAGRVYAIEAANTSAAVKYLKLYNKASAPTVGTDVPVMTVAIPATSTVSVALPPMGMSFATGIALAITGAGLDTDTTATAVGDVSVTTQWI